MQIPTICSLSPESTSNSVLTMNTVSAMSTVSVMNIVHALGGRGLCIKNVDTDQDELANSNLAAILRADIIQLSDAVDVQAWVEFLPTFKMHNPAVRIVLQVPINADIEALQQLINLVDIAVFNSASLAYVCKSEITSVHAARAALYRLQAQLIQAGLPSKSSLIYQTDTYIAASDQGIDIVLHGDAEFTLASDIALINDQQALAFVTALTTVLAQDYPLDDALVVARAYCNQIAKLGRCQGWPRQRQYFPTVVLANSELGQQIGMSSQLALSCDFASCETNNLGLYPVVDSLPWLEKVLQQGVKTLQLRIKGKTDDEVAADIQAAVVLGRQYQARLFINDYWQLAIKFGAYGVHLGQEDMLVADFVAIKQAGLRLGLSTHGYYEILRAHAIKPSYIALGHIFPTVTKDMPSKPQGLLRLQKYADLMLDYPLVAIGGISLERAPLVAATGVGSIAVVTAITRADDYQQTIADFQTVMQDYGIGNSTSSQQSEAHYG